MSFKPIRVVLRGFHERETREAFHITSLFESDDFDKAESQAEALARAILEIPELETRYACDGFFIDVYEVADWLHCTSFEVIPGRPMVVWYGADCSM